MMAGLEFSHEGTLQFSQKLMEYEISFVMTVKRFADV